MEIDFVYPPLYIKTFYENNKNADVISLIGKEHSLQITVEDAEYIIKDLQKKVQYLK